MTSAAKNPAIGSRVSKLRVSRGTPSRVSHQVGNYFFEFVSVPYTTLRVAEGERSQTGM